LGCGEETARLPGADKFNWPRKRPQRRGETMNMKTKMALILSVMAAVCFITTSAAALDYELEVAPTDWEEAIDFAVLLDVSVDEYGVVWEMYLDEEQQVSWVQPASASREEVLELMLAGEFGESGGFETEDICIYLALLPYKLTIEDGWPPSHYYTFTYQGGCGSSCWRYYHSDRDDCWTDVEGYIRTLGRTQQSYTMFEYYMDLDSGGVWCSLVDDDEKYGPFSGYYYYEMMEDGDLGDEPGEDEWDYCSSSTTLIAKYKYYACDAWRYLEIGYRYNP
jgi:hypothetical protein